MSDGDFLITDAEGNLVGFINIDQLTHRAKQIAARLAIASGDAEVVHQLLIDEIAHSGFHGDDQTRFLALVLQGLTTEFLGPLLTFARLEYPYHDFIAELREHAGERPGPGNSSGSSSAGQGGPDDDQPVVDGR